MVVSSVLRLRLRLRLGFGFYCLITHVHSITKFSPDRLSTSDTNMAISNLTQYNEAADGGFKRLEVKASA
jgi:hypothetical protein